MRRPGKHVRARQIQVLRLIDASIRIHGWPPTIRELQAQMGFRSTNAITSHIKVLERGGMLRRIPSRSRAFIILEAGKKALEAVS